MATRIQQMVPEVAASVAAGEVITQPASVVKELLENSADAASGRVLLEVVAGGHELIRVSDDGSGIHPDDLLLSLKSHTTSKLLQVDDLNSICTYGFRGEALASIRAVCKLKLASALSDGDGHQIEASGEKIEPMRATQMPKGTQVEVLDLFFNLPARRKFLATPATDLRRIRQVFRNFALARPEMALEMRVGEKREMKLAPAHGQDDLYQRLITIVGSDWQGQLIPLNLSGAGMHLRGWMGTPDRLQARPTQQYFFINDRPVFDKLLSSAARVSLGNTLGRNAHPLLAIWLQVEPDHLDVNVHPAKEEVRFLYPRAVHGLMRDAVAAALTDWQPVRGLNLRTSGAATSQPADATQLDWTKGKDQGKGRTSARFGAPPAGYSPRAGAAGEQLWVRSPTQEQGTAAATAASPAPEAGEDPLEPMTLGSALAHLHGVFILAQNSEGLVIVDAHAAHERCLLEQTRAQLLGGELTMQPYLTPLQYQVGANLADVAEEHADKLLKLGLDMDRASKDTLTVRALPSLLGTLDPEELVLTALDDFARTGSSSATDDAINHVLGNLCCRAATRAGMPMTTADMDELLRAMERLPHSSYCNHGRPSWHLVPMSELDRLCHRGR